MGGARRFKGVPVRQQTTIKVMTHGDDEHAEACAWFAAYLDALGLEHEYEPRPRSCVGHQMCSADHFKNGSLADGSHVPDIKALSSENVDRCYGIPESQIGMNFIICP